MYIMANIDNVDICCGLSWGDEGKGKIVSDLLNKYKYDWVCRWNGGSNAGHTIYMNDKKYATHIIPAGIFHNIPCFIGPECFINYNALISEMEYLKNNGFDISKIFFSKRAHVVSNEHINEDCNSYKKQQGSTGMGIAPCAKDKYARRGRRIEDDENFPYKDNIWYDDDIPLNGNILCEGSQGFWLDINYGNYPYVTSATTLPYGACSLGFPPCKIRNIYGAVKVYDTRVGVDPNFSHKDSINSNEILEQIADIGEEYGTTTKRKRKVEWLNMDKLVFAINTSGSNIIIFSKIDILDKVGKYKYIYNNEHIETYSNEQFQCDIYKIINEKCKHVKKIIHSNNPYSIDGI